MIKKKKNDNDFINIYNMNDKIINDSYYNLYEDNLIIDCFIFNNIKNIIKHFNVIKNNAFKILLKNLSFNNKFENYFFIKNFNIKYDVLSLFNKKVNIYYTSTKTDNIDNYALFIGLINDDYCVPFWNDKIKLISDKLFIPLKEKLKISNKPKTFNYKNWFETEHYVNNSKTDIFNKLEIKRKRKRNFDENNIKTLKVKLLLNQEQKEYIIKLYDGYRYFYNRALQFINNYNKKDESTFYYIDMNDIKTKTTIDLKNIKIKFSYMTMRKVIKNNYPKWFEDLKTIKGVKINFNSHLIDKAFKEASDNYNKCIEKFKKNRKPFELKPKTKKNKFQTMNIEKTMFNIKTKNKNKNSSKCDFILFPSIKNKDKTKSLFTIKIKQNISKYDCCDSSITCNKSTNEYYLNLSYHDNSKKDETILKNNKICSVDPGLACLLNIYTDNEVHYIGKNILTKLNKVCKEIDKLTSMINLKSTKKTKSKCKINYKYNSNKRRNLKKVIGRKTKYIKNLKEELHNKSVKYLTSNYGKIIIPNLESQKMSKTFNSKLARSLYNISFSSFMNKLKTKCEEYDIELVTKPEYYTSKTCTKCGCINKGLRLKDRTYKCKNNKCLLEIDRDINASRNIMLRNNII